MALQVPRISPDASALTIVVLNWQRAFNIPHICAALRRQNIKVRIVIWSNQSRIESDWDCDEVVYSSQNLVCWPRWFLCAQTESRFVMVMDDDLLPNHPEAIPTLLGYAEQYYDENVIVGLEGVRLSRGAPYFQRDKALYRSAEEMSADSSAHFHFRYLMEPARVDIIKGRLMLMKPACLRDLPMAPPFYKWADDIVVSAHVAKRRTASHVVAVMPPRYFADLPHMDGAMALSGKGHVREEREQSRLHYFDYV